MTTTYLGLATVPTNSTNPSVPVNNAMAAFDAAIAGTATRNLVADANYTLLPADYLTSLLIITDTGPVLTAGRDIVFPAGFPRMYVTNSTAKTLTLKKAGQTGIALAAGATSMVYSGATDVQQPASGAVSSVNGASGAVVLGGESIAEPVTALTPVSGVVTINCSLGDYFTLAPTANVTSIVFTNLPAAGKAQTIMVSFTQDSTARTVTWPASFKWAGGTAGAVSTGSGAIDVLALTTFNQGTTWNATLAKAFA
jgi:hypothetical protein